MNQRRRVSFITLCLLAAVASVAADQKQGEVQKPVASASWTPPRTSWGDPDIQGIWMYKTTTPLQRPPALGDKEFYTEEEAAKLDAGRAAAPGFDQPPRQGQVVPYQSFWLDVGKIDINRRTSLILDPKDGRLPAFTPEGEKRIADRAAYRKEHPADSVLSFTPDERCIMYHGVPPLPGGYNATYQVFQVPGYVAILDEAIHDVRMIPLDQRPHLGNNIRHWNGDSRGRWDGNTLVVETTNYRRDTNNRFPSSEQLRSTERFTRVGRDVIELRFTIDDPGMYTRPWTALLPLNRTDDKIYEYACHEGNYAMEGMLSGARTDEKASAGARVGK